MYFYIELYITYRDVTQVSLDVGNKLYPTAAFPKILLPLSHMTQESSVLESVLAAP
jgi:hypothetical protein